MPVSPPLTVKESDGSVSVRPTNVLSFNAADFTVSGSGDTATISIDSTGTGAALTDTYVGYGNASNLLTGSTNFTYDGSEVTIKRADAGICLTLESTDDASAGAPDLRLRRNSPSPAVGDDLGIILFTADDSVGNNLTYADIAAEIDNPTDTEEAGRIQFRVRDVQGGSTQMVSYIRLLGDNGSSSSIVFNEGGLDVDFRYESESITSFVKFDAANSNVGIGGAPDSGVERLHVQGTGTTDMVMLESSDAGTASAPDLVLYRNSASAADNDFIGRFDFRGKNSGGSDVDYVMQTCKIQDASNDAGRFGIFVAGNASLNADDSQLMIFGRTGLTDNVGLVSINNSARSDVDLRVSSDNLSNLIRTKASSDNVGIGVEPNSNTVLHISNGGGKANTVRIESTDNDTSVGPVLDLRRNNADGTATDGDNLGVIQFTGLDDGGGSETYARIRASAADTHSTQAEGAIEFLAAYNNVETEVMRIGPVGDGGSANFGVDINYNSQSTVDFRVRGDNVTNLMYIDSSTDKIGFGEYPAGGGPQVQVEEDLSCLRPYVQITTATLAATAAQCHNKVVHLTYDTSAVAVTLPTAVSGMCITLVRQQATNAPTVVAASGEKINGTAAPSTVTMGAQYSVMILHGITGTGWIAYEPAVAS